VRILATGYSSEVRSQTLANNSSSTVNVAMSRPGSVAGQVTAGGTTPLPGAAVTMFLNGIQKGAANSDASGNYSIGGLHPGSYTLQVVDVGYRTKEQGVVINDNAATTANVGLDVAPAGPVSYAYDALGRLVSVVDASGDAATYTYDAVGNILSIGRVGAGTVAITQVTPNSGIVGAPVTLYGTGFSPTPVQNTVTFFNNKPAVVTSSTATQIVTSVPANATSGTIAVTSPLGSATSSSFTVSTATAAPTISGFTPVVALPGTALTVSGTNFDMTAANDQVTVNQTFASLSSASATSLGFPVPAGATSGPISVSTAYGAAVSTTDLIVPPAGYTAADIEMIARIGFGDPAALTVPVNTSGKIAIVLFDGIAGRRASFKLSDIAYPLGVLTVITPYNVQLASSGFTSSGLFLDTAILPVSGTYTIIVKPSFTYSGSVRLTVYDVPPDVTGPIVPGGATVTANLATPGQNARYTFTGSVNQRVALSIGAGPAGTAAILSPEGLVLGQSVTTGTTAVFFDTITLTKAGIYTAFANPTGANTGSLALTLHNAADITTSITPGGASVNVATSIPGQRVVASFTATAGQRVSLNVTNVALSAGLGCKGTVSLVDSSNTTLRTYGCLLTGFDSFLDVTDPLAAGGYTAVFDPAVDYTGSATLRLYDVTDLSGTLGVNDPSPTTVSFTTPGQNAALTFSGTSGQLVTVTASGNTFPPTACVTVRLFRQDGTTQLATATSCSASFALAQQTLPATENYIVRIDPAGSSTGSVGITVTNP
jgi:YD repeat-containing protein